MKLVRVLFVAFLMMGALGCGNQAETDDKDEGVQELNIEMPGEGDEEGSDDSEKDGETEGSESK